MNIKSVTLILFAFFLPICLFMLSEQLFFHDNQINNFYGCEIHEEKKTAMQFMWQNQPHRPNVWNTGSTLVKDIKISVLGDSTAKRTTFGKIQISNTYLKNMNSEKIKNNWYLLR